MPRQSSRQTRNEAVGETCCISVIWLTERGISRCLKGRSHQIGKEEAGNLKELRTYLALARTLQVGLVVDEGRDYWRLATFPSG
jgi:hypothetical protein